MELELEVRGGRGLAGGGGGAGGRLSDACLGGRKPGGGDMGRRGEGDETRKGGMAGGGGAGMVFEVARKGPSLESRRYPGQSVGRSQGIETRGGGPILGVGRAQ